MPHRLTLVLVASLAFACPAAPGGTPDAADAPDASGTPDASDAPDAASPPDAGDEVDAGESPDAGEVDPVANFTDEAALSICGHLFRCCDDRSVAQYFAPFRGNTKFEPYLDLLPPAATLTEDACPVLVSELLGVAPFADWLAQVRAGRVAFDRQAFEVCKADLDTASCGREGFDALIDSTCFGLQPPEGGASQRKMFQRLGEVDDTCAPVADGFGGLLYGTCDPEAAFCCHREVPGGPCRLPNANTTGTCKAASPTGGTCSDFLTPLQMCQTGTRCGDDDRCAPLPTAALAPGAECVSSSFLLLGECTGDAFCDVLGTRLCTARKGFDAECVTGDECRSGLCGTGRCLGWDLCSAELEQVTISLDKTTATVRAGQQVQATATVTGNADTSVTFSVLSGEGTISTNGSTVTFTAGPREGTTVLRARSNAYPARVADLTVTVQGLTVTLDPPSASLAAGATQQFVAQLDGVDSFAVTWSIVEGAGAGTITSRGLYTAPQASGIFHVRATAQADATRFAEATVTVTAPQAIVLAVSPANPSVVAGGTVQFTATADGTPTTDVTWTTPQSGGGSISSTGLYTAPMAAGSYTVVATSTVQPSVSAQATVTVTFAPAIVIAVTPATAALNTGDTLQFAATADGASTTAVTWSVQQAGGGTISSTGLYTAPGTPGSYTVVATSTVQTNRNGTASVTVSAPPAPGGTVSTVAGNATAGTSDGLGAAAAFREPKAATLAPDGNLYVSDWSNHCIRRVTPAGDVTTIAGLCGNTNNGTAGGVGSAARFYKPSGIAFREPNGAGNGFDLYVADQWNHCVRKLVNVAGTGWSVSTFAGTCGSSSSPLKDANDLAFSGTDLYVTRTNEYNITRIGPTGTVTQLFTGGFPGAIDKKGQDDGTCASVERVYSPTGITAGPAGTLYFAGINNCIRVLDVSGGGCSVSYLAGYRSGAGEAAKCTNFSNSGSTDGATSVALFNAPHGLAYDNGSLFVADVGNNLVRKVTIGGATTVSTVAGTLGGTGSPVAGFADGAALGTAKFNGPYYVALDGAGGFYVIDRGNNRVRRYVP